MNHLLDMTVILVRIIIDIPILYFLYRQYQLRKCNGNIKRVRRMVSIWVLAFAVQLNYAMVTRFFSTRGVNTLSQPFDVAALCISLLMLGSTLYGTYIFEKIAHEDLNKQH